MARVMSAPMVVILSIGYGTSTILSHVLQPCKSGGCASRLDGHRVELDDVHGLRETQDGVALSESVVPATADGVVHGVRVDGRVADDGGTGRVHRLPHHAGDSSAVD